MKKIVLLSVFAAFVAAIVFAYSGGAANQGGIDGTAATSGSSGCGSCHHSATTDNPKVELDSAGVSVTSYHPGTAYTVKISATNGSTTSLSKFGFQVTVVKAATGGTSSPADAGTWGTMPGSVQKTTAANSGLTETIIEQSGPISATSGGGAQNSTYVESIPWTAPAAGTGSVKIYGVMNELTSESNSKYQVATAVTITEATATPVVASVSIAETSGSTTICAGSSVTFTATPTNGGTAPTYQWKVNGTAVSGATNATYTTTTLTAGSNAVTCVMTSNLSGVTGSPATSNSITVTVNASVTPSVSVSTSGNTVCSGQSVTLTATPTNGGTTPTYQWKNNGTAISGATSASYSSSSLATGSVITCVLTSNATCASPTTATSNSETITVTSSVTPSVSIASSAGSSICSGQSVTLTATPTNGGTTPTYQWYKNGTAISGATSSTYTSTTLANNDAITCGITSNATCASPTTATSSAITFTITANGTASVSITANPGSTICTGQNVTFTATPGNGGSAPTYQWYKGSTAISGATNSTYASSGLANGDAISCKMVSNSGCVTTTNATSNTITIAVSGAVTPAVSISSSAGSTICAGQSTTFTAAPVNGGSSPSYQWYNSGSAISGATSSTYTSSSLSNGAAITVVLTSSSSCASPTTATSNAITMNIGTGGTASVSVQSSNGTTLCGSQGTTLTATPNNGGSAPTYQWLLNGTAVSGATNATYTPATVNNGDAYTVQMTSNSSCVSQPTVVSTALTFTISQGGAAVLSISSAVGLNICQGTSVIFNATPTNGGSNPTYQWTKNGSNVGGNNAQYTDATLVNGDVIACQLTSSLSCASPGTAASNSLTMNVFTPAAATITNNNGTLVASQGATYQWYLNNISVTNGNNQSLVPTANGDYTVEITDAHGCQSISTPFNVTFAGINDPAAFATLSVYPNPVENALFIDFGNQLTTGKVVIRLMDLNGRTLVENAADAMANQKIQLDMSAVQDGIYLLQVSQNDASAYRKIVVGR